LVIFLTVVLVLGKFAWKPLLAALKAREDFIRESLENAKKEREESATLLAKYTEQINKAREEATAITQEGRRDAEEVRRRISAEARAEADAMLKRSKREIEIAHQDAISEIYNTVADLSTRIAERVLRREIDTEKHRDLVARALEEVKQQGKASSN
jgi:F-type H+-transporting ATPase subunit b